MKIWLDDEKPPPNENEWLWIKNPEQAIEKLDQATEIALDNDMGYDTKLEGYDVLVKIEERAEMGIVPPKIRIITFNPVAKGKMEACILKIAAMGYNL